MENHHGLLAVASTVLMQSLVSARLPVWLMMLLLKIRLRWTTSVFPEINQTHNQRWLMCVHIYHHSLILLNERWHIRSLTRLHCLYPLLGEIDIFFNSSPFPDGGAPRCGEYFSFVKDSWYKHVHIWYNQSHTRLHEFNNVFISW